MIFKNIKEKEREYLVIFFLLRIVLLSILPFIPIIYIKSSYLANTLISIFLFGDIIGGILLGYLFDKISYQKMSCILSFILLSLCLLLFLTTNTMLLYLFLFLLGFMLSGLNIGTSGILAKIARKEYKEHIFATKFWVGNVSSIIGIILGFVFTSLSAKYLYLNASIICLFLFIFYSYKIKEEKSGKLIIFTRAEKNKSCERINNFKKEQINNNDMKYIKILLFFICNFFIAASHQQITSNYPIFLSSFTNNPNKIYTYLLIFNIILLIFLQKKVYQFSQKNPIFNFFLYICMPFGMFLFGFKSENIGFFAFFFYSLGEIIIFPKMQYFSEKYYKPHLKSTFFGIFNVSRLGFAVGPVLGIFVANHYGFSVLFSLSAIFILVASLYLFKEQKQALTKS